jgi:hypothetical protein
MKFLVEPCRARIARGMSVLALAGTALSGSASADVPVPFRQMRLVRAPSDDLHIEWRATVRETGGEFLVVRGTPAGARRLVARLPPGPRSHYHVTDTADPGARVYELRYRDARGRERVLATIEVDLEGVERAPAAAAPRAVVEPPLLVPGTAGHLSAPSPVAFALFADDAVPFTMRGRPPTPPPRVRA